MRGPRLKKRWGQHHLVRKEALQPLLAFLDPSGKRVLEIGSGGGVLTSELARVGATVIAWEIDLSWVFALRRRCLRRPVQQVAGDVLDIEWSRLAPGTLVAGNLPYNIASPVLDAILSSSGKIARVGILIQKEVAERLAAVPKDPAYGALSVLTQARASVELLGIIEAAAFRPPPKVESAFVGLTLHPQQFAVESGDWTQFRATVLQAFAYRRKTLVNSLGVAWGRQRAASLVRRADLAPTVRAQEIGVAELALLARLERETRDS